jgi:NitT/TauT family transport system ATP-binding protein
VRGRGVGLREVDDAEPGRGLDTPSAGQVHVQGGRPALMFQESALFPWLTVEENVAFPLQMQGVPRASASGGWPSCWDGAPREVRASAAARAVGRDEAAGGAGAGAGPAGELLLMDEPFAALDAMMRDHLHSELETLWQQTGLTVVFVTHNVREAVRLGDRVVLLSSRPGRLLAEYRHRHPAAAADRVAGGGADWPAEITDRLHEAARDA